MVSTRTRYILGALLILCAAGILFASNRKTNHATYQNVLATMQAQFVGFFVAQNRGHDGDQNGTAGISSCARIHPFEVSEANRVNQIPSFCSQDAHGFYDWLCYFDTSYSLQNNWPERVTREEVEAAKEATQLTMWLGGPFDFPPPNVVDFVLDPLGDPNNAPFNPTIPLNVWSGAIRKFNAGVILEEIPDPYFQIQRNHTFTYPNGVIFDQNSLVPGKYYTLRLQICSSEPVRPGSPTKDSSTGPVDGWANVRAEASGCWWDRAMVIQIKDHDANPDFDCGRSH